MHFYGDLADADVVCDPLVVPHQAVQRLRIPGSSSTTIMVGSAVIPALAAAEVPQFSGRRQSAIEIFQSRSIEGKDCYPGHDTQSLDRIMTPRNSFKP